jgi:hypothetical protein
MGVVSLETCRASYKSEINFDSLLHQVVFFNVSYTVMHVSLYCVARIVILWCTYRYTVMHVSANIKEGGCWQWSKSCSFSGKMRLALWTESYQDIENISLVLQKDLTLILLTWKIRWASYNANELHMGFNSAVKGLTDIIAATACSVAW